MAVKKTSKRIQSWRQQKIKDDKNQRSAKQQQLADQLLDQSNLGEIESGTVVTQYGKQLLVEDRFGDVHECVSRRTVDKLVCGDRIQWQNSSQGCGVIVAREPRSSELGRPNYQGRVRVIAANIDYILVVVAPEPKLDEDLINRYLLAAELTHIPSVLVVNKIDLLSAGELSALQQQLKVYQQLNIDVLYVSSKKKTGFEQFSHYFTDHLAIVVGQSGVGKSSIIKTLLPKTDIRVGSISSRSKLGKHTTTAAQLYRVDGRGGLVDSPGIREFGVGHISPDNIALGFVEFKSYLGQCKFNDCRHQHEPGCAVKEAVANAFIDRRRYDSYLRILKSLGKP